jgi:hypothetical protein
MIFQRRFIVALFREIKYEMLRDKLVLSTCEEAADFAMAYKT